MEKTYKYAKQDIVIPSGTAIAPKTHTFKLDHEYKVIEGVQAIVKNDGGVTGIDVSFSDDDKIYVDLMDSKAWDNTDGVSPKDQYIELGIEQHTNHYYVNINRDGATTTDLKVQFVLKLSKPKHK